MTFSQFLQFFATPEREYAAWLLTLAGLDAVTTADGASPRPC
jgi:hypothetical protein